MCSRKDYVAVAREFARQWEFAQFESFPDATIRLRTIKTLAEAMADVFAADNSRFDRSRFLSACGVQ